MWGLPEAQIPAGWQKADGTNGTLDLTGRFARGATVDANLGVGGGDNTHDHTFTTDGHNHGHLLPPPNQIQIGSGLDDVTTIETDTGTTDSGSTLPLHRRVWYIQKVA